MSRSRTERRVRRAAAAFAVIGFALWLAGCASEDLYLDRRDTVGLNGGDAVAGNTISQMVDPWPAESGNKNIAFNGQRMQSAQERYRTGKVIAPADPEDFMSNNQTPQTVTNTTVNTGVPPPPTAQ